MIWCVCMIWQFIACCFECFEYCLSTTDLYSPSLNSILHLHGLLVSGYGGAGKPDKSAASWQRPPLTRCAITAIPASVIPTPSASTHTLTPLYSTITMLYIPHHHTMTIKLKVKMLYYYILKFEWPSKYKFIFITALSANTY